ncbi:MAG: hypothetical protein JWO68_2314 [Actinomycetia bacterium]|nr:hypothetical protein [Actinomycetes bacterium]
MPRFLPTPTRSLGALVVVLLVANGGAWYQLGVRSQRGPSFSRGGSFLSAGAAARVATTTTSAPPVTTAAATTAPPTTARPAPANSYAPDHVTAAAAARPDQPGVVPALGTYRWRVVGHESATGFGSRQLPAQATQVAHAGDDGQVVLDTTYSQDHQERLIVGDRGGALAASYEGGQVRFGPMAQANSGSYRPTMTYVPADLRPGAITRGTTQVLDDEGGVQRVEDWTVTVVQRTTIPVLGTPTAVWEIVLERQTEAGSDQQVHRVRRQWWDPNRRGVVRYQDTTHGQQRYGGITFTFDSDLTADLTGYTAP